MTIIGDEIQELIRELTIPELQDTDITVKKLCAETRLSPTSVHRKMQPLLDSGKWRMVEKRDNRGCPVQTFEKVV